MIYWSSFIRETIFCSIYVFFLLQLPLKQATHHPIQLSDGLINYLSFFFLSPRSLVIIINMCAVFAYSLDARGGPLAEASHLAMSDDLGSRSYFITDDQPSKARLRIQHVNMHDEGVFRCRVDFNNSPTRNFQVNLTLVGQSCVSLLSTKFINSTDLLSII